MTGARATTTLGRPATRGRTALSRTRFAPTARATTPSRRCLSLATPTCHTRARSAPSGTTHPTDLPASRTAGTLLSFSLPSSCHFSCSRVRGERITAPLDASGSTFTTLCDPLPGATVTRGRLVVLRTDGAGNGPLRNPAALAALGLVAVRVATAARPRIGCPEPPVRPVRHAHAMSLAATSAHLSVLLRKARTALSLTDRGPALGRHLRPACRGACPAFLRLSSPARPASGASLFTLFRHARPARFSLCCRRGALGLPLRGRLAAALSFLSVDPLVPRAVRRACDLSGAFVPAHPAAALRKLPRGAPHRGRLRQAAPARCLKRREAFARPATGGVRGHATTVLVHAAHELRPVHFVSHASVLHEPARASESLCTGFSRAPRACRIRPTAVDRRERRHAHRVRPIAARPLCHAI